ncbi:MAG: ABC transporter substrate-binding protein [Propionibacteriaceae bacterium]|jgi:peptide/nickel transport system substrate-binding protein|nr:ABC transporter substrate-binding protein [Propionibacteriaceae bacterium]
MGLHRWRWLGLGLAAALVLGACGEPIDPATSAATTTPPPTAPTTPSPSPTPTVAPVAGIHQTERSQLTAGGELAVGLTDWPADWNPWTQDLSAEAELVLAALRPRLFDTAADGTLTPNPDWLDGDPDVTLSPATVVTFHLNPAATWGDGEPVSADDFAATWEFCAATAAAGCDAGFAHIVAVAAGDNPTDVVVTFDGPYPEWRLVFRDGPARAGSAAAAWTDLGAQPGWFAGPFAVELADAADQELALKPNALWWGDAPLLDRVTFRVLPAAALAEAFAAGEIAAWPIGLDAGRYQAAARTSGAQLRRSAGTTWRVLAVGQTGVLADERVRQALLRGLDRRQVGAAAVPGLGWTVEPLGDVAWQPGQADYADRVEAAGLGFDRAAAAALLDAAGWTLGPDGLRAKGGSVLRLTFGVDAADPLSEAEGLQVAAQWRELGIVVTLVAGSDADVTSQAWANDLEPEVDLSRLFRTGAAANVTGYANAAVDAALSLAAATSDAAGRARLVTEVAAQLVADVAVIPLYVLPETWATRPALANFGPPGLATWRWENVGWA